MASGFFRALSKAILVYVWTGGKKDCPAETLVVELVQKGKVTDLEAFLLWVDRNYASDYALELLDYATE